MGTGQILRKLVGPKRSVDAPDVIAIGVASTADVIDLLATDVSAKLRGCALRTTFTLSIAAMASVAAHAFMGVNTGGILLECHAESSLKTGVAIQAHVSGLCACLSAAQDQHRQFEPPGQSRLDLCAHHASTAEVPAPFS
jgi:hypothetical protein